MRHYKNIEELCQKAEKRGFAYIKSYANGNGFYNCHNMFWNGGNKYELDYSEDSIVLKHYNVVTLQLCKDLKIDKWHIDYVYGESKSDCESIQQVLEYFGIDADCHYYPSKELFTCIDNVSGQYFEV